MEITIKVSDNVINSCIESFLHSNKYFECDDVTPVMLRDLKENVEFMDFIQGEIEGELEDNALGDVDGYACDWETPTRAMANLIAELED